MTPQIASQLKGNRGTAFPDLIRAMLVHEHRYKLVKTGLKHKMLADGVMLSMLAADELLEFRQLDRKFSAVSEIYKKTNALPIEQVLPKRLGAVVRTLKVVEVDRNYMCVLAQAEGLEAVLPFMQTVTLLNRHPESDWFFAARTDYNKKPLVLVDSSGIINNKFAGCILPLPIDNNILKEPDIIVTKELNIKPTGIYYPTKKEDGEVENTSSDDDDVF